jgi:betaine lipid synthase
MGEFLPVESYFRAVYMVDLSPSLCKVAEARFQRLGWNNVKIICEDARYFRLAEHLDVQPGDGSEKSSIVAEGENVYSDSKESGFGADLITLSFALSMIPEFYPVIDSLSSLLSVEGIVGACDFYVQSQVDYRARNYTGGVIDRHCNFWSRTFWRTWFEVSFLTLGTINRTHLELD